MALRSDRHRTRPIAALVLDAGTTIGPQCATIHVGQEAEALHGQAEYTTATDTKDPTVTTHSLDHRGESRYGLLRPVLALRASLQSAQGVDDARESPHPLPPQCDKALLHEYPLRVGRRGPHFSGPSAGATLRG